MYNLFNKNEFKKMKSKFGKQGQDYPGTRFTIRAQQPWPGFVFSAFFRAVESSS